MCVIECVLLEIASGIPRWRAISVRGKMVRIIREDMIPEISLCTEILVQSAIVSTDHQISAMPLRYGIRVSR